MARHAGCMRFQAASAAGIQMTGFRCSSGRVGRRYLPWGWRRDRDLLEKKAQVAHVFIILVTLSLIDSATCGIGKRTVLRKGANRRATFILRASGRGTRSFYGRG